MGKNDVNKVQSDIRLLRREFRPAVNAMVRVIKIYNLPFKVFETLRSKERQKYLHKGGTSLTRKGKHPKGMAVDIVGYDINKKAGIRWSWTVNIEYYILAFLIKHHVVRKYKHLRITWGGNFKKFFDPYHWEMK